MLSERVDVGRVSVWFTDRHGGVSLAPYDTCNVADHVGDDAAAVAANRRRVAQAVGVDAGRWAWVEQVHGADVAIVDTPTLPGGTPVADALVTTSRGLPLA